MKVLVTGGSGFIGAALVKALLHAGEAVRVLDNGFRGNLSRLQDVSDDVEIFMADIRHEDAVIGAAKGVDAIYHLAFINGTENFYKMPGDVLDVGVRGIVNVVAACKTHKINTLMLVSSSEVYQTPPAVPTDETAPLSIPDLFNPRYSYAAGKIISEMMAVHCAPSEHVVIVRPHNVYGPNMGNEHVIPHMVRKIVKGEPIKLWGISQTRAFCHIDDAVDGLMIARNASNGVYNLGTTEEVTIADLAVRVARLLALKVTIVEAPVEDGGALRRCPDIRKLAALGYCQDWIRRGTERNRGVVQMKVGIIGVGVVGGALQYGFNRIGHEVVCYDIKWPNSRIEHILSTDIAFICVPTPSNADGSCDVSRVNDTVDRLAQLGYPGLAVIKSTVTPGTTARLIARHHVPLAFCPEFLREKATYSDFVENHEVCIIGTDSNVEFDLLKAAHDPLPKAYVRLTPTEAELAKYFCNTFNAARIVFASQFFEVCEALGADYRAIKSAVSKRSSIGGHYLDCNKNFRSFGGACLPKDVAAIAALVKEKKLDAGMFEWILLENEKVIAGAQ